MKAIFHRLVLAILLISSGTNCTTAYDAYGRPQEVVDPAAAVIGAAAVGLLAYGLASSNNNHHERYYRDDCNYRSHNYYRPSYGYSRYNRGYCGY